MIFEESFILFFMVTHFLKERIQETGTPVKDKKRRKILILPYSAFVRG